MIVLFNTHHKIIRSLLVACAAAVFLWSASPAFSSGRFAGEEKVRHSTVLDKASRGEAQDLIVVFDEGAAVQRADAMRAFSGATHDTRDIVREKSRLFRNKKQEVLNTLTTDDAETIEDYDNLPVMFLRVKSQKGLERLAAQPGVMGIYENRKYSPLLQQSLPLIGQPEVAAAGYTGSGTAVAVLDTGVDYTRSAFGACTGGNIPGDCLSLPAANGACKVACVHDFAPDDHALDDHGHGTNVSGIVAGVAPDAHIVNLDVFRTDGYAYTSDITAAINWVIGNRDIYNIVSMNMSFGGDCVNAQNALVPCKSPCANDVFAVHVADAKSAGILSAIAAGNDGYIDALSSPACVPAAVSVGAVYDGGPGTPFNSADKVPSWSNSADFLTILAPGSLITAAGSTMQGTSQATPHIAGSIAVLRSAFPAETPDQTVARMISTGKQVLDLRNYLAKSRIDLEASVNGAAASYVITGQVVSRDGLPSENVTLNLTGDASGTTVSDVDGFYEFTNVSNGSYTVTPVFENAAFVPSSLVFTVSGSSRNLPIFTMTNFSISGRIRTASGQPVAGITVTLGGDGSAAAMTDSTGRYVFSGLGNGTYTVMPAKTGFTFTPPSKTIVVDGADKRGKRFTAVTYAIKGYVRNASGRPMAGVTVSLEGDVAKTKKTDINGFYRFGNLPMGTYVVTPSKAGKTFDPASTSVTISGASEKLQTFKTVP